MKDLFRKYDIPAPRYTSYPTVPYWESPPTPEQWIRNLNDVLARRGASLALYLHIPYCETLCTFCGCNTVITRDHQKEEPYVQTVLREWGIYRHQVPALKETPIKHLHLGGGTPTFLSAQNLERLLKPLLDSAVVDPDFEGSIEVDPRRTNSDQLRVLKALGFSRVSLGVQDFNADVQSLINRTQPYEMTANLTAQARELGFESVNFDLIYGLARQTKKSIQESTERTLELRPDRIALYSLALVPWIKPAQRLFKDEDLPAGQEKRELYDIARETLLSAGYLEIGMDHFALPTDALAKASLAGKLHRNFMGYTDHRTDVLLGLGVSSISETPEMFHQNEKVLPAYEREINKGEIPTFRGHVLTEEDRERRQQILDFMTQGRVRLTEAQKGEAQNFLAEMHRDGLVEFQGNEMLLTEKGKPFLRNACVFFDERLKRKQPQTQAFSKVL